MNTYHIWSDLKDGIDDQAFCQDLAAFLDHLVEEGRIHAWRLQRRKLGFGPEALGEFHITMEVEDLAQLDTAFELIAPRTGATEKKHAKVWSKVTNFKAGLWRDYPDPARAGDPSR